MASLTKIIFLFAVTMALSIAITMKTLVEEGKPPFDQREDPPNAGKAALSSLTSQKVQSMPSKRVSRFLADTQANPRRLQSDHCHKDGDFCYQLNGKSYTCCNNKCVDLSSDKQNCGACKSKCKFTYTCCNGQCVDLNFDKRHCGDCSNRCPQGDYCIYGMCAYN